VKKGCFIVAIVLLALALAGLGGGAWYASRLVGLREAPAVSHAHLVDADTRLIAVARPRQLLPFIEQHVLPLLDNVQAPAFLVSLIRKYATEALPNEIAVLGSLAHDEGAYRTRLFINERRFGPLVAQFTAEPARFANVIEVDYDLPVFAAPKRGVLTTERSFPLLRGLDNVVDQFWPPTAGDPFRVEDGRLFEAVFDNRTGDLLHLIGARARARGLTLPEFFNEPTVENVIPRLLILLTEGRAALDLTPDQALEARVQVNGEESDSPLDANAAVRIGPAVLGQLGADIEARRVIDAQRLPDLVVAGAESFTFDMRFDNRANEFMTLLEDLGLFDSPEMQAANIKQQLEIFRLMTQASLSGKMTANGDLVVTWRVDSAPGNEGAVYIALGFLPFDSEVMPLIEEYLRYYGMTLRADPPTMEDGAAYLRKFTIGGFKQNVLNFLRK